MRLAAHVATGWLFLATGALGAHRRSIPLPCPDGRFHIAGFALMDPGSQGDMIDIANGRVTVQSGCDPTTLSVHRTRSGAVLRARWARCRSVGGAVRLRAAFTSDCETLHGRVVKRAHQRFPFDARRDHPAGSPPGTPVPAPGAGGPGPGPESGTFAVVSDRIFLRRGCTVSSCHGEATAGGLDLRPGAAYASLVGVPATGAPGASRVVPGLASESFLSRKLRGLLSPTEGARMPLGGDELSVLERDLVDIWIDGGAPASGDVPGAPTIDPVGYQPAEAPPPPPGGVQLVLDGPLLQPGQETEGCLWVPAPNATDLLVSSVTVVANPGTHHVVVWRYNAPGIPQTGVWRAGDVACLSGAQLGTTGLAGAGMGNGANTSLPPGIASVLPGGGWFGLNAHYYNEFDVPIQIKVWFNFFPYQGTPQHIVQTFTALDTTFGISVPPLTTRIRSGRYRNDLGKPMYMLRIGGHMHKRGVRFSAWHSDGTKAFDDYDWSHPVGRPFDPPYVLAPGDWFDYECLHDNGVTRPVRRDAFGNPTTLVFGISAEDEMCILTGSYYTD